MSKRSREKKQNILVKQKQRKIEEEKTAIKKEIDKSKIGIRGGFCNRTNCRAPGANYYNRGNLCWYCEKCAKELNIANRLVTFEDGKEMCLPVPDDATDEQVRELTMFVPRSWLRF